MWYFYLYDKQRTFLPALICCISVSYLKMLCKVFKILMWNISNYCWKYLKLLLEIFQIIVGNISNYCWKYFKPVFFKRSNYCVKYFKLLCTSLHPLELELLWSRQLSIKVNYLTFLQFFQCFPFFASTVRFLLITQWSSSAPGFRIRNRKHVALPLSHHILQEM